MYPSLKASSWLHYAIVIAPTKAVTLTKIPKKSFLFIKFLLILMVNKKNYMQYTWLVEFCKYTEKELFRNESGS
jgi:hypothetical protein